MTAGRVGLTLSAVSVSRDRREHLTASAPSGAVFRWLRADKESPSLEAREGLGSLLGRPGLRGMTPLNPPTDKTARQRSGKAQRCGNPRPCANRLCAWLAPLPEGQWCQSCWTQGLKFFALARAGSILALGTFLEGCVLFRTADPEELRLTSPQRWSRIMRTDLRCVPWLETAHVPSASNPVVSSAAAAQRPERAVYRGWPI